MATTRLKIDLAQGVIEVEGSEDFVRRVYSNFKGKLDEFQASHEAAAPGASEKKQKPAAKKKAAVTEPKASTGALLL